MCTVLSNSSRVNIQRFYLQLLSLFAGLVLFISKTAYEMKSGKPTKICLAGFSYYLQCLIFNQT